MRARLLELAIEAMGPDDFENLVFALVRVDEPTARQLRPPDVGRDTVVPATDGQRERAWQAKHHTSGIRWRKCEESLKTALEHRNPEEVTFVFPVNMNAGEEPGLEDLRRRYPQVRLPEPWTLGTLREKLAEHPEIRREHIDKVIGVDHEFAEKMFERGAALKERWESQTAAAVQGPLAVLGQAEAAAEAEAAVARGEWAQASDRFEEIGEAIADRAPAVADVLFLRAARAADEAGDRSRAGHLHLRVSRAGAARGDSVAEYAAFRASWQLPEDERWRSFAATARAAWPERPEESIPVLTDAFTRCLTDQDREGAAEWGAAACEALATQGEWAAVADVAASAAALLGPVEDDGPGLDLELDLLDARSELGENVDADYMELLLAPIGRQDTVSGRLRARWGTLLARRGRAEEAALRFDEATDRWRVAGDGEEEIAEAVLSADAAAQVLGMGLQLDQTERIAVAELRGRGATAAVIADRKETEGLRSWLAGRGYDARRALTVAWSLHRRAGHLGGCLRLAVALHDLFKTADDSEEALTWSIRAGRQLDG